MRKKKCLYVALVVGSLLLTACSSESNDSYEYNSQNIVTNADASTEFSVINDDWKGENSNNMDSYDEEYDSDEEFDPDEDWAELVDPNDIDEGQHDNIVQSDNSLLFGASFGMPMEDVLSSTDLGRPYEMFDNSLWYNLSAAIIVDKAEIPAEYHYDFNERGELARIRIEFEGSSNIAELKLVAKYFTNLGGGREEISVSGEVLSGSIHFEDYTITGQNNNIYIDSIIYPMD